MLLLAALLCTVAPNPSPTALARPAGLSSLAALPLQKLAPNVALPRAFDAGAAGPTAERSEPFTEALTQAQTQAQAEATGVAAPTTAAAPQLTATPTPGVPPLPASAALPAYVYATTSATNSYDIMLNDGSGKDRRVARIKVDSIFFGDISAHLSADGTTAAFRVSGDRYGGSSLFTVDIKSGKYAQVAATKSTSEGIGTYSWSPMGNTLAYTRVSPALDPGKVDESYGAVYVFSLGFQAVRLKSSHGSDRVIGFSGDGLGVYVTRHEALGDDLVYLPLSGDEGSVLLHSQAGLRYSNYAVWAPRGLSPRVAYLTEGDFTLAGGSTQEASKAPVAGKLSRPNGLGLVVSDPAGTRPGLLRRDLEDFTVLKWTADGLSVLLGGTRSSLAWAVDMEGSRHAVGASLTGLDILASANGGPLSVLADTPTSRLVTIDHASGKVVATRYVGATVKAGPPVTKLNVPYIHQVNDTVNADGNWACGPTSIAMTLAYYGKIQTWTQYTAQNRTTASDNPGGTPVTPATATVALGTPRPIVGADYGPYITRSYTYNGHTYNAVSRDPRGNLVAGLYGTICPTGSASWPMMADVLEWHGLNSAFIPATWDGIVAALKRGHPVLIGNEMTAAGHIILAIGYTADGNLIANDPYGNRFAPGYGGNNGQGVLYPWKRSTTRRAVEVIGVYPPPTFVPTRTPVPPTATASPTHTATPTELQMTETALPESSVFPVTTPEVGIPFIPSTPVEEVQPTLALPELAPPTQEPTP